LYVVGDILYDDLNSTYRPLCNEDLPAAYFEPESNPAYFSVRDGFINAFDLTIFSPIVTGVSEINPDNNLIVFPNPTSEQLNIIGINILTNIIIYDMHGNSVMSIMDINQNFTQVDIGLLSSGCYTVIVTQNDQQYYSKFIRE
jgi:DNA gyrase inhibitor GyrI